MRSGVARLRAFALALAAIALGLFAWCWQSSPPPMLPSVAPAGAARTVAADPAAGVAAPGVVPAAAAVDLPRRVDEGVGLSGVVLDDQGAPLGRILIYLRQADSKFGGVDQCCTDAAGRFRFPRANGSLALTVENDLVPAQQLALARGEARFVELRAIEPCLVLCGTVRRAGQPVPERFVYVRDAADPRRVVASEATDAAGHYVQVLQPGKYWIEIATAGIAAGGSPAHAMGALALGAADRMVVRDFDLPVAEIRVRVRDANDMRPLAAVQVTAALASPGARHTLNARTAGDGTVAFTDLIAARWCVTMADPTFTFAEDQFVEVGGAGACWVDFLVTRAGSVQATLHTAGRPVDARRFVKVVTTKEAGETIVVAQAAVSGFALHPLAGGPAVSSSSHHESTLGFARVAPGRYELRAEDRCDGGVWSFAPFVPFVSAPIDVSAGAITSVDVEATPRASLDVIVRDAAGTPWLLPVTAFGPQGEVQLTAGFFPSTPAPPGEYRIVVQGPDGAIERRVTHGDRDTTCKVGVPGTAPASPARRSPAK